MELSMSASCGRLSECARLCRGRSQQAGSDADEGTVNGSVRKHCVPHTSVERQNSIKNTLSGCSADGSVLVSGTRGHGFKSRHSDHKAVAKATAFLICIDSYLCASAGGVCLFWARNSTAFCGRLRENFLGQRSISCERMRANEIGHRKEAPKAKRPWVQIPLLRPIKMEASNEFDASILIW